MFKPGDIITYKERIFYKKEDKRKESDIFVGLIVKIDKNCFYVKWIKHEFLKFEKTVKYNKIHFFERFCNFGKNNI